MTNPPPAIVTLSVSESVTAANFPSTGGQGSGLTSCPPNEGEGSA